MPRTKEPPETLALSDFSSREKHELGVGEEDDCGNDTLVNRGTKRTEEDVATERRKEGGDASGSDSSPTGSSDEFDWDEEDGASATVRNGNVGKAKRGRAAYLAFMRLARPLRVTLLCIIVGGILIAPLLVVHFLFHSSPVKKHVFAWSIWLTAIWVAGCLTYVVVDGAGWAFLGLVSLFGGKTESLQMQLEVRLFPSLFTCARCLSVRGYLQQLMTAVSAWVKLALDISWAWISLSIIQSVYKPPGTYWTYVNQAMQVTHPSNSTVHSPH